MIFHSVLTIPSAALRILNVLYKSTASSTLYGPRANNIGTTVLRNSSNVLTGKGAPLLFKGSYRFVRILEFKPLCLQVISKKLVNIPKRREHNGLNKR